MALRFGRAPWERKKLTLRVLPAAAGRVSTDEYGIRMKPYHIFVARSIREAALKPEFHTHPSSWRGASRSMSRSIHSPWGEISNSRYLRMFLKFEPMNTSATSRSEEH